jgi:hypothetical protein
MADLKQLKQKYAPIIGNHSAIFTVGGGNLEAVSQSGEKLLLKGSVPSTVIANRVWDVIKSIDPTYSDLQHQIDTTGGAEQLYTNPPRDNLSKINNFFNGSLNKYEKMARRTTWTIQIRSAWAR